MFWASRLRCLWHLTGRSNHWAQVNVLQHASAGTKKPSPLEEARARLKQTEKLLQSVGGLESGLLKQANITKDDVEDLQRKAQKLVDRFDPDSKDGRLLETEGLHFPEHRDLSKKEPVTELGEKIRTSMASGGPWSISRFMKKCLQDPEHGYYTRKREAITTSSVEGQVWTGDFVTSPELFSGFGQCLGVWTIMTWEQLAKPQRLSLVELGPGNGTMIKDILEIVMKEKKLVKALDLHLVESSPILRQRQMDALGVKSIQQLTVKVKVKRAVPKLRPPKKRDGPGSAYRITYPNTEKAIPDPPAGVSKGGVLLNEPAPPHSVDLSRGPNPATEELGAAGILYQGNKATTPSSPRAPPKTVIMPGQDQDLPVPDHLRGKPSEDIPISKVLPSGEHQPTALPNSGDSPSATPSTTEPEPQSFDLEDPDTNPFFHGEVVFQENEETRELWHGKCENGLEATWHTTVDSLPTGHEAIYFAHEFFDALPIQHFRYGSHGWQETMVDLNDSDKSILNFRMVLSQVPTISASLLNKHCNAQGFKPQVGDEMEISTAGTLVAEKIGRRIAEFGGAGVVIDYGRDGMIQRSLQGMRDHKPAEPLSSPGNTDMTAHVDFGALKSAFKGEHGAVKTWGPVDQSYFLQGCGVIPLSERLLKETKDLEERKKMLTAVKRILDVDQMGSHFKVLGVSAAYTGTLLGFWEPEKSNCVVEMNAESGKVKRVDMATEWAKGSESESGNA